MNKIKNLNRILTYKSPRMSSTNTQTITGKLPCKKSELDLGITLKGGQSFR